MRCQNIDTFHNFTAFFFFFLAIHNTHQPPAVALVSAPVRKEKKRKENKSNAPPPPPILQIAHIPEFLALMGARTWDFFFLVQHLSH